MKRIFQVGGRVIIGKNPSLKGTITAIKNTLVDVVMDGHKKPSTFLISSLRQESGSRPVKSKKLSRIDQPVLIGDPVEVWRDRFISDYSSHQGMDPSVLLGRRFPNPRSKTPDPKSGAFDFQRFLGFGQFLAWLDVKTATQA